MEQKQKQKRREWVWNKVCNIYFYILMFNVQLLSHNQIESNFHKSSIPNVRGDWFFIPILEAMLSVASTAISIQSSVSPKILWHHRAFVVRAERIWDQIMLKQKQNTGMLAVIFKCKHWIWKLSFLLNTLPFSVKHNNQYDI